MRYETKDGRPARFLGNISAKTQFNRAFAVMGSMNTGAYEHVVLVNEKGSSCSAGHDIVERGPDPTEGMFS